MSIDSEIHDPERVEGGYMVIDWFTLAGFVTLLGFYCTLGYICKMTSCNH